MSSTSPTQIRIDTETKQQATELFRELGLDMSSAVNLFLKQCVLREAIPFEIAKPHMNKATLDAMEEAKRISRDETIPSYDNINDLRKALET